MDYAAVFDATHKLVVALSGLRPSERCRAIAAALAILGQSGPPTPERDAVLEKLAELEPTSAATIAAHMGKKATAIHNHLSRLMKSGLATKTPDGWVCNAE